MEEKILRYLNNNLNKELNLQELCTYLKLNSNEVLETINTLINKLPLELHLPGIYKLYHTHTHTHT